MKKENENENNYKIIINDAIMGSGKTTKAIEQMKNHSNAFLYVTPFLTEVDRVLENVPNTVEPKQNFYKSANGVTEKLYKRESLLNLASKKSNIVTTHSLFSKLKREDYKFFKCYDLILDEVIMPIKVIDMKSDDIDIAIQNGLLVVNEETSEVSYTGDDYNGRLFAELKGFCETRNVTYLDGRLLVWSFPTEIFTSFKSVTILTYLFEGSLLASYFKFYGIEYKIVQSSLEQEIEIKNKVAELLNIYQGKSNDIGERNTAFSVNWLKGKNNREFKRIKDTVSNILQRQFNATSAETAFTTFKEFESNLKGKGYSKGFIAVNERATNAYSEKTAMVYLANRFLNPSYKCFFREGGVEVNEDLWALSELLQWIWRGCIRNNEPMDIFIPSKRMRNLLIDWLKNDINSDSLKPFKIAA
ncbi:DEAD/DEAH box helicase family protein [Aestuariibaculum sp. M13]|uniref:DEAD/DEAH box helicase family protein n=1 Tax=Aestuariibaculum sp. M13 TaxID=2967132 RepID=UPI00215A03C2|nr:DEAD/DEAH box helicase family protein [Aestuariibaculum sp. M13]MCR8667293.1 DEAD/DEAH box helicase family protein [Aestuariibaculum sp. M13]